MVSIKYLNNTITKYQIEKTYIVNIFELILIKQESKKSLRDTVNDEKYGIVVHSIIMFLKW